MGRRRVGHRCLAAIALLATRERVRGVLAHFDGSTVPGHPARSTASDKWTMVTLYSVFMFFQLTRARPATSVLRRRDSAFRQAKGPEIRWPTAVARVIVAAAVVEGLAALEAPTTSSRAVSTRTGPMRTQQRFPSVRTRAASALRRLFPQAQGGVRQRVPSLAITRTQTAAAPPRAASTLFGTTTAATSLVECVDVMFESEENPLLCQQNIVSPTKRMRAHKELRVI
jgi:hypothetical protein